VALVEKQETQENPNHLKRKKDKKSEKRKNSPDSKNNKPDKKTLTTPDLTAHLRDRRQNSSEYSRAKDYSYHVRRMTSNDSTL
jgi:hypothetical protein